MLGSAHYVAKIKEIQVDKPVTPTMQVNKEQEKKEDPQLLICLSTGEQHFQRL